jgi:hypothetical protein
MIEFDVSTVIADLFFGLFEEKTLLPKLKVGKLLPAALL